MSEEEFEHVYPVWLQWRATEKRFLPTELRRQPQQTMDGILYLDSLFEKMVEQQNQRREKK